MTGFLLPLLHQAESWLACRFGLPLATSMPRRQESHSGQARIGRGGVDWTMGSGKTYARAIAAHWRADDEGNFRKVMVAAEELKALQQRLGMPDIRSALAILTHEPQAKQKSWLRRWGVMDSCNRSVTVLRLHRVQLRQYIRRLVVALSPLRRSALPQLDCSNVVLKMVTLLNPLYIRSLPAH